MRVDEHRLADARAAEEADLAALEVGLEQVDDFDAGEEHLLRGGEVFKLRRLAVDGQGASGIERRQVVDGLADHVQHAPFGLLAHGHADGRIV